MHRVQPKNDKTSSPLQYILQAAMGQCSTLPTDGNKDAGANAQASTSSAASNPRYRSSRGKEKREPGGYHNGRPIDDERHSDGDVVMGDPYASSNGRSSRDVNKLATIAKNGHGKVEQYMNADTDGSSSKSPRPGSSGSKTGRNGRSRVHVAPSREEILPPPPAGAVRTRCYRLNLDAPVILSPTHDHLGPMPYEPPAHLMIQRPSAHRQITKSFSNESVEKSPTQVAINTARIFRGITVDKNGTILSQNARATRSSRGKEKSKQAASSRQTDKINKAKDLVDDANLSGGKENEKDKSNMVSLIIVGEYDEMKQLVRDGAKKLRDAQGLPDEALLSINRPRQNSQHNQRRSGDSSLHSSSSRKRFPSPSHAQTTPESPDNRSKSRNRLQQNILHSAPPKLKSHPRDRPSSRRLVSDDDGKRRFGGGDKCNDMSIFGGGDSDWSDALGFSKGFDTIWNCGATGKDSVSPNNNKSGSSSRRSSKVRYEGRNESSARFPRGGGVAAERDAPVSKDVMIL